MRFEAMMLASQAVGKSSEKEMYTRHVPKWMHAGDVEEREEGQGPQS